MRRIGFIPHDQDREDQRAEERAERRAMKREQIIEAVTTGLARFEGIDPTDAEYADVETFAEFLADDEREEYTHGELQVLNANTGKIVATIKAELAAYGFRLKGRPFEKQIRGFTANPNAGRFDGMHGGGGGTSIQGLAGYAG
jgi:hypothetical protein